MKRLKLFVLVLPSHMLSGSSSIGSQVNAAVLRPIPFPFYEEKPVQPFNNIIIK